MWRNILPYCNPDLNWIVISATNSSQIQKLESLGLHINTPEFRWLRFNKQGEQKGGDVSYSETDIPACYSLKDGYPATVFRFDEFVELVENGNETFNNLNLEEVLSNVS